MIDARYQNSSSPKRFERFHHAPDVSNVVSSMKVTFH